MVEVEPCGSVYHYAQLMEYGECDACKYGDDC